MPPMLKSLSLAGFRTYRDLRDFDFGPVTVLIGGNASGKSNLISFFRLWQRMMRNPGELQAAVAEAGGAGRLLHDGPKTTPKLTVQTRIESADREFVHSFELGYSAGDKLVFLNEDLGYGDSVQEDDPSDPHLSAGNGQQGGATHFESQLGAAVWRHGIFATNRLRPYYNGIAVHHFADTGATSGMRQNARVSDSLHLHPDGSNLAAVLYRLQEGTDEDRKALRRIEDTLRLAVPCFAEFVLEPLKESIILRWRERNSPVIFDAAEASDGMLRLMAMITLLGQPEERLPSLIVIDEPELGLHPQAISLVASLIRVASQDSQLIITTQSPAMVDEFQIGEIAVASRMGRETTLQRLREDELAAWLDEFTAGEIWQKNLVGGGPGT
jgi:predicted ATPase